MSKKLSKGMKDIRIDGRMNRVFVLKDADERIIYIPIAMCHRVDYERFKEIAEINPGNMLDQMKRTKLSNGRNALTQYDSIIQVGVYLDETKTSVTVIHKDGSESKNVVKKKVTPRASITVGAGITAESVTDSGVIAPVRRRPGPKPKPKPEQIVE